MRRTRAIAMLFGVGCAGGMEPDPPYPATVVVSPETAELRTFLESVRVTATVKDQNGNVMDTVPLVWSSEDTEVATVSATGIVSARGTGEVKIVATAGAASGAATITVALVQRYALLKIYESLSGADWTRNRNWGTKTALRTWSGVETDGSGNVLRLNLTSNNLSGEIPAEIELLEHLQGLDLSFNESVTGAIPPEIAELENLTALLLHHNSLTGQIPPEIAGLTGLDSLDLHRNELSGPLPAWLGDLENLRILSVWGNDFTGSVPASLGNLNVVVLNIDRSPGLSGPLPRTLMDMSRIVRFHWHTTDLCSPPDDEFQDWLMSLGDHIGGSVCDS